MMEQKTVEQYLEQMRQMAPASATPSVPAETTPVPMTSSTETEIPFDRFLRENWAPSPAETGTGFLQIRTFGGRGALPVVNARVTVSKVNVAKRLTMSTNGDGLSPVIPLPTVDRALSQTPERAHPFSTYEIRVDAAGLMSVVFRHVPVFDGVSSVQNVNMVAPETGYSGDNIIVIDEE